MLLLLLLWLKWFDYFYTILPSPVPFSCHFEPLVYNVQLFIYIHVVEVLLAMYISPKSKRKAMFFVACKMIYSTMLVRQMHRVKPSKWLALMICFDTKVSVNGRSSFIFLETERSLNSSTTPTRFVARLPNPTPPPQFLP